MGWHNNLCIRDSRPQRPTPAQNIEGMQSPHWGGMAREVNEMDEVALNCDWSIPSVGRDLHQKRPWDIILAQHTNSENEVIEASKVDSNVMRYSQELQQGRNRKTMVALHTSSKNQMIKASNVDSSVMRYGQELQKGRNWNTMVVPHTNSENQMIKASNVDSRFMKYGRELQQVRNFNRLSGYQIEPKNRTRVQVFNPLASRPKPLGNTNAGVAVKLWKKKQRRYRRYRRQRRFTKEQSKMLIEYLEGPEDLPVPDIFD